MTSEIIDGVQFAKISADYEKSIGELLDEKISISIVWSTEYLVSFSVDAASKSCGECGKEKNYRRTVSTFTLNQFPGNGNILVSTNSQVNSDFRGKGVASKLHGLKEAIALKAGAKTLMATVNGNNKAQIGLMEKRNWRAIDSYKKCNGEDIITFVKSLQ